MSTLNRETVQIETPVDKKKVVLKKWLIAREKREISEIFLSKTSFNNDVKKFNLVDSNSYSQIQDKEIEMVVVSVDDVKENVLDMVLNMKVEDFDFVWNEVEKIVNPEIKKK